MIGRFSLMGAIVAASLAASVPLLAQGATAWERVHADSEGVYFYDRASLRRTGDRVRVTMRLAFLSSERSAGISYIADYDFDCAGQTSALLAAREIGPGGEELRSIAVPAERVETIPIDARSAEAPLYRAFCPGGAELPEPPPMPAIVATPRGSESCASAGEARRCGND